MDSYREHPSDFEPATPSDDESVGNAALEIGSDERRMHVRAYNYWVSLLHGRDYPSIEDLEPADVSDFAANSVLLDFTAGREHPATPYIGAAIREECGLSDSIKSIAEVPSRSLLSRLTDHYLQIIANRAPIGFEAEFVNQRGVPICYRGILMPFSSDGDTIDFIYGVINWKRGEEADVEGDTQGSADPAPEAQQVDEIADPGFDAAAEVVAALDAAPPHFSWEDGPLADPDTGELALPELGPDAALADRLWAAREGAEALRSSECRSRAALYKALSLAYDFALGAIRDPEDYAELLEESGMKAQARAPMTPIIKLVFGIDYDKARLTEFAAALSYGQRQQLGEGEFLAFIEAQAGGLKALVAAERQARRPEPRPDTRGDAAKARLRDAAALSMDSISAESEFTLVLARRRGDGGFDPVAVVDDEAMVERAIRRAA